MPRIKFLLESEWDLILHENVTGFPEEKMMQLLGRRVLTPKGFEISLKPFPHLVCARSLLQAAGYDDFGSAKFRLSHIPHTKVLVDWPSSHGVLWLRVQRIQLEVARFVCVAAKLVT